MKFEFGAQPLKIRRVLLIFCLLGGLLFSCSEGVRLLPFPAVPDSKPMDSAWNYEVQTNYLENLHRFENGRQTNSQSKSHFPDHWLKALKISVPARVLFSSDSKFSSIFGVFIVFRSADFARARGSRAPPRL